MVFLPGLTADHRLFVKQIKYFEGKYPVFVWDAPGHALSWPFSFDFNLMDNIDELWDIDMGSKWIIAADPGEAERICLH